MATITEQFTYPMCGDKANEFKELKYQLTNARDMAELTNLIGSALNIVFMTMGQPALAGIVLAIQASTSIEAFLEDKVQSTVRDCQYAFEEAETFLYDYKDFFDLARIEVTYNDYTYQNITIPYPEKIEVVAFHQKTGGWILK